MNTTHHTSFSLVYKKPTDFVLKYWDKWDKRAERKDHERQQKGIYKEIHGLKVQDTALHGLELPGPWCHQVCRTVGTGSIKHTCPRNVIVTWKWVQRHRLIPCRIGSSMGPWEMVKSKMLHQWQAVQESMRCHRASSDELLLDSTRFALRRV